MDILFFLFFFLLQTNISLGFFSEPFGVPLRSEMQPHFLHYSLGEVPAPAERCPHAARRHSPGLSLTSGAPPGPPPPPKRSGERKRFVRPPCPQPGLCGGRQSAGMDGAGLRAEGCGAGRGGGRMKPRPRQRATARHCISDRAWNVLTVWWQQWGNLL